MTGASLSVIWCDDIRNEVGNKKSFMGVYTNGIAVPTLPAALPRLALFVTLKMPLDQLWGDVNFTALRDDDFTFFNETVELPRSAADAHVSPGSTELTSQLAIFVGGIELLATTKALRVIAKATDGRELVSHQLPVMVQQPLRPF